MTRGQTCLKRENFVQISDQMFDDWAHVITFVLLLFGLQLMAPVFASARNDVTLPDCCRGGGKQHCMIGMKNPQDRKVTTIAEKYPYCPLTPVRIELLDFAPTAAGAVFASVIGKSPQ
jgi:hypothetical protein